jgi:hypothetical protein
MGGVIVSIAVAFMLASADSQIKISLAIIGAWARTSYKQFSLLAGKAAPHEFLQLIIYKASTFAPEIEKLDTVRAYHVRFDQYTLEHLKGWQLTLHSRCRADRITSLKSILSWTQRPPCGSRTMSARRCKISSKRSPVSQERLCTSITRPSTDRYAFRSGRTAQKWCADMLSAGAP